LKYIIEKCPGAEIEISSNVSLLDAKMQKKLVGLNIRDLRLSVFGFTAASHHKIMPGLNWKIVKKNLWSLAKNKALRQTIGQISLVMIDYPGIKKDDITSAKLFCKKNFIKFEFWGFLDRGKNVRDYSNNIYKESVTGCEQRRPQERMHITFAGLVVLCCMDWKLEYVLGDLNKQTIKEVWNSDKYQKIREDIQNNHAPGLCRKCKLAY
jgi:radical SAM protein with 4Fe4S-binding SPASM domain